MRRMLKFGIGPFIGKSLINFVKRFEKFQKIFQGFSPNAKIDEYEIVWNRSKAFNPLPMTLISALFEIEKEVLNLDVVLKISKPERQLGFFIIRNREAASKFENSNDCGKFLTGLMLDSSLKRDESAFQRSLELAKYLGKSDVISELKTKWESEKLPPKFPVNGIDVGKAGIAPGPGMKKVLTHLQQIWKDSNFLMSKDELLSRIEEVKI